MKNKTSLLIIGLAASLVFVTWGVYSQTFFDGGLISPGTVTATQLGTGSVTSAKILNGTIQTIDIADNAITAALIADGAVDAAAISDNSITSAKILDATILGADIASETITTTNILDGTISNSDLSDNSVTSPKILDGTILNADYSDNSISNAKLQIASVGPENLDSDNSPSDEYFLSYESSTQNFEWQLVASSGGTVTSVNGDVGPAVSLDLDEIPDGATYARVESADIFANHINRVYEPGSTDQYFTFTSVDAGDLVNPLEFDFLNGSIGTMRFNQSLRNDSDVYFQQAGMQRFALPGAEVSGGYPYLDRIDANSTVLTSSDSTLILIEANTNGSVELPFSNDVIAGQLVIVKDVTGTAGTSPITISVTSGDLIDGVVDATYVINTNYGEAKFVGENFSGAGGHETDGGWWTLNGQPFSISDNTITSNMIMDGAILNADISDNTIAAVKLATIDTPADEECATYESGSIEWQPCTSGTFFDTAGTGLTSTGSTVNANAADTSITMNADNFGVNASDGLIISSGLKVLSDQTGGTNLGTVIFVSANGVAVGIDDVTIGANGSDQLYVKDSGITANQLNISVAGTGLTGGGGTPLSVGAGTGITVSDNNISVNSGVFLARADVIANEVPNEACNGVTTAFTVDNTIVQLWTLTINGLEQRPTTDFTVAGLTITLTTACATGDSLLVDYTK